MPAAVTIVIFGGSGDLAHRKLLPALYNLHVDRLLPPKCRRRRRRPQGDERRRLPRVRERRRDAVFAAADRRGGVGDVRQDAVLRQHVARRRARVCHPRGAAGQRGARRRADRRSDLLPGRPAGAVCADRETAGAVAAGGARSRSAASRSRASSSRNRSAATWRAHGRSTMRSPKSSTRSRSTASITTSGRRPSRTSWCCGSPTASSSRCST